jgi:hypothetical protein
VVSEVNIWREARFLSGPPYNVFEHTRKQSASAGKSIGEANAMRGKYGYESSAKGG